MSRPKKVSLYFFIFLFLSIGIIWILTKANSERLTVVALGLGGSIAMLGGYIALPVEFKYDRLLTRFVALQSLSAGIFLWVAGVKTADVQDWILYFFAWNFILIPFIAIWLPWLKKNL